jgi:hypothetical protein
VIIKHYSILKQRSCLQFWGGDVLMLQKGKKLTECMRVGCVGGWGIFLLQKVLEAFMIILSLFELLYLLSLHAGIFGSKYGPTYGSGYGNNAAGTGVGGPKAGNYGTPAASAV